jgi:hypothetical protein
VPFHLFQGETDTLTGLATEYFAEVEADQKNWR